MSKATSDQRIKIRDRAMKALKSLSAFVRGYEMGQNAGVIYQGRLTDKKPDAKAAWKRSRHNYLSTPTDGSKLPPP